MTTLYGVLGVDPRADIQTIRHAYRALAREHHPDFGGDLRRMMSVNEAWHVLSDPERRASYDSQLLRPIPKPRSRDGHTVMDYGRYEGWSLADIVQVRHRLSRMAQPHPDGQASATRDLRVTR